MAMYKITAMEQLTEQFRKLPGIGGKTASRLAYSVFKMSEEDAETFGDIVKNVHKSIHYCKVCCGLSDDEICPICSDESRQKDVICCVSEMKDVAALERTGDYKGSYHVLHGVLSPLKGIGPGDLRVKELLERIRSGGVSEVIMATSANMEGDATAVYISKLLKPMGVTVSRLAYGLPVGSDLDYADEMTLTRSMRGRVEI